MHCQRFSPNDEKKQKVNQGKSNTIDWIF